jgi:hypothetical protein
MKLGKSSLKGGKLIPIMLPEIDIENGASI